MLREEARRAFLREVHRAIAEASELCIEGIASSGESTEIVYPPGQTLSKDDRSALAQINSFADVSPALGKLMAHACATAFFHVFSVMDGVVDPKDWSDDVWLGVGLADRSEHGEPMLHDEFLDSYRSSKLGES